MTDDNILARPSALAWQTVWSRAPASRANVSTATCDLLAIR